ncbi:hypothetical protein BDV93DRAFT_516110 [Ceratobasidium sp. AG-I]|nr:hypothetical protein BDV93DRAFT_516110 [Ceratobasidium sp. AG-I]
MSFTGEEYINYNAFEPPIDEPTMDLIPAGGSSSQPVDFVASVDAPMIDVSVVDTATVELPPVDSSTVSHVDPTSVISEAADVPDDVAAGILADVLADMLAVNSADGSSVVAPLATGAAAALDVTAAAPEDSSTPTATLTPAVPHHDPYPALATDNDNMPPPTEAGQPEASHSILNMIFPSANVPLPLPQPYSIPPAISGPDNHWEVFLNDLATRPIPNSQPQDKLLRKAQAMCMGYVKVPYAGPFDFTQINTVKYYDYRPVSEKHSKAMNSMWAEDEKYDHSNPILILVDPDDIPAVQMELYSAVKPSDPNSPHPSLLFLKQHTADLLALRKSTWLETDPSTSHYFAEHNIAYLYERLAAYKDKLPVLKILQGGQRIGSMKITSDKAEAMRKEMVKHGRAGNHNEYQAIQQPLQELLSQATFLAAIYPCAQTLSATMPPEMIQVLSQNPVSLPTLDPGFGGFINQIRAICTIEDPSISMSGYLSYAQLRNAKKAVLKRNPKLQGYPAAIKKILDHPPIFHMLLLCHPMSQIISSCVEPLVPTLVRSGAALGLALCWLSLDVFTKILKRNVHTSRHLPSYLREHNNTNILVEGTITASIVWEESEEHPDSDIPILAAPYNPGVVKRYFAMWNSLVLPKVQELGMEGGIVDWKNPQLIKAGRLCIWSLGHELLRFPEEQGYTELAHKLMVYAGLPLELCRIADGDQPSPQVTYFCPQATLPCGDIISTFLTQLVSMQGFGPTMLGFAFEHNYALWSTHPKSMPNSSGNVPYGGSYLVLHHTLKHSNQKTRQEALVLALQNLSDPQLHTACRKIDEQIPVLLGCPPGQVTSHLNTCSILCGVSKTARNLTWVNTNIDHSALGVAEGKLEQVYRKDLDRLKQWIQTTPGSELGDKPLKQVVAEETPTLSTVISAEYWAQLDVRSWSTHEKWSSFEAVRRATAFGHFVQYLCDKVFKPALASSSEARYIFSFVHKLLGPETWWTTNNTYQEILSKPIPNPAERALSPSFPEVDIQVAQTVHLDNGLEANLPAQEELESQETATYEAEDQLGDQTMTQTPQSSKQLHHTRLSKGGTPAAPNVAKTPSSAQSAPLQQNLSKGKARESSGSGSNAQKTSSTGASILATAAATAALRGPPRHHPSRKGLPGNSEPGPYAEHWTKSTSTASGSKKRRNPSSSEFEDDDEVASGDSDPEDSEPREKQPGKQPPAKRPKGVSAPKWSEVFQANGKGVVSTASIIQGLLPSHYRTQAELPITLIHNLFAQTIAVRDYNFSIPKPTPDQLQKTAESTIRVMDAMILVRKRFMLGVFEKIAAMMKCGAYNMLASLGSTLLYHKDAYVLEIAAILRTHIPKMSHDGALNEAARIVWGDQVYSSSMVRWSYSSGEVIVNLLPSLPIEAQAGYGGETEVLVGHLPLVDKPSEVTRLMAMMNTPYASAQSLQVDGNQFKEVPRKAESTGHTLRPKDGIWGSQRAGGSRSMRGDVLSSFSTGRFFGDAQVPLGPGQDLDRNAVQRKVAELNVQMTEAWDQCVEAYSFWLHNQVEMVKVVDGQMKLPSPVPGPLADDGDAMELDYHVEPEVPTVELSEDDDDDDAIEEKEKQNKNGVVEEEEEEGEEEEEEEEE